MRNLQLLVLCGVLLSNGCEGPDVNNGPAGTYRPITVAEGEPDAPTASTPANADPYADVLNMYTNYVPYVPSNAIPEDPVEPEDPPAGVPTMTIGSPSVVEGNSGTVSLIFTLTLSGPSSAVVSVEWAPNGALSTAENPTDFDLPPGGYVRSFAPGNTSQTIVCKVHGDTSLEGDETIVIDLYVPHNVVLGNNRGIGTIINDD